MKKRLLTLALVLAMCLSLAIPAFAVEGKTVTTPDGKFQLTNVVDTATLNVKSETVNVSDLNGETVYLVKATGARLSLAGEAKPEEVELALHIYEVLDGALEHEDSMLGFWDDSFVEHELTEERQKADEAYFQDGMGDIREVSILDSETEEALATVWIAFVKEDYEPAPDASPEPTESAKPEDKDPEPSESVKPAAPAFTDVPEGVYYAEPVAWAVEKKITNGTEPTKFEPATTCSQIQILTFLYRAVQSAEDPDFAPDATDLTKAAEWAKEKGMIDDTFDGSKPCTRATSVNYIWQAFGKPKAEKKSEFTDVKADADYADAVDWAVEKEITDGYGSLTIFAPDRICDRGQIVTLLNRAYTKTEAPETPAEPTPSEPVESAPVESAPVESTAPQESAKPAT